MAKISLGARLLNHTLTTASATFSVPTSEDYTDGTWTINDLALSEIGVNETDKRAYIRIDDEIKEFQFTDTTLSLTNGLSYISSSIGLGGTLSQNTTINGNSYRLTFNTTYATGSTNYFALKDNRDYISIYSVGPSSDAGMGSSTQSSEMYAYNGATESLVVTDVNGIRLETNSVVKYDSQLTNVEATTYVNAELTTNNNTAQTMYTLPIASDRIASLTVEFLGLDVSGSQGYTRKAFGAIKNIGGSLSIVGTTIDYITKSDFATAVAQVEFTGTNILFTVQGETATTINWAMRLTYQIGK